MNQKKCPKCGEMNPGEAVMCWACYTPLAGAAGAGVAGGAGAATMAQTSVATHDDEGGKKAIAPWQMGVVGVALLLALGLGARTMMGGETIDETITPPERRVPVPGEGDRPPSPPPPSNVPQPPGGNPAPPPIVVAPYTMAVPPNPAAAWGVMAIVPTEPNTGSARAASLAAFARRQQMRAGNWKAMHIYVFQDAASANLFKQFQVPRRSEVLAAEDYSTLTAIWPRCLARYEFNGGRESVRYPSRAPTSWWFGRA